MRVAVTGATGLVGRNLVARLLQAGHQPVALTRDAEKAAPLFGEGVEVKAYDPYDVDDVAAAIQGADGIVNLAGENVFAHRWGKKFKQRILDSRVETTKALVQAIEKLEVKPEVLVSGSAVGFYGPRPPEESVDESTIDADKFAPGDFLSDVCRHWERAAGEAERSGVRVVRLRIGVVLARGGGALKEMERPFKMFVGGPVGNGKQIFSWVHVDDLCGIVLLALTNRSVKGPLNAVSPGACSNRDFSKTLGRVLRRPCWLPVPAFGLRIVLGQVAEMLTTGQRVLPQKAEQLGYPFQHRTAESALNAIYGVS